jgi:REP element-mobilizing transposase RayT
MQRDSRVIEGHLLPDHVHVLISIPPKYAVAQVVGYLKGKSAIHIARTYLGRKKNFTASIFGPAATLCRPSEQMKRPSASISGDRSRKIVAWSNDDV